MTRGKMRLLSEVSYYPDYMRFTSDEMSELFDMFWNVIKSVWQSIKLLTATLELNLRVVFGTWTNNRKMIDNAFDQFQAKREKYDVETAKNLKYFKEYYTDAGPGPKFLAFVANPLLFVGAKISSATIGRAEGEYKPYDVDRPIRSTFGITPSEAGATDSSDSSRRTSSRKRTTTPAAPRISPRLKRALDFFEYNASLSESATVLVPNQLPKAMQDEMLKLQSVAKSYVESERENANEILKKIAGISSSVKKLTDAKDFDEIVGALRDAESAGLKVSVNEIVRASKNIRSEFEKQQKEDPDGFMKSVELMRKKSTDIKDEDPIEAAMKFVFGISKSKVQQQLIDTQEQIMNDAKATMNLPIDQATKSKLEQSDTGREYLKIVDNFEEALQTGERSVQQLKSNLKSAVT